MSWSHTLQLPKSKLANRSSKSLIASNLGRVTSLLYSWQYQQPRPEFVLHDGPPYANGELHMGHALNKVLKDIVLRFAVLSGCRVKFLPGWDCHGLPIELTALKKSPQGMQSALERRNLAKSWALKMVDKQLNSFREFGVMANWDDPSQRYLTLNPSFVVSELRIFAELVQKNLVFRQRKPVYWSTESGTALAESELVYGERESTTAYFSYSMTKRINGFKTNLAVWTTTPWTLVANQAVAVHLDLDYVVIAPGNEIVKSSNPSEETYLICAADLVTSLASIGVVNPSKIVTRLKGSELVGHSYVCPLRNSVHPVVTADHVTNATGTGLVHTAPGHGKEDFLVGQKVGLQICSPVDGTGKYTSEISIPELIGVDARSEGTKRILKLLESSGNLLQTSKIRHSVPLDWRTKSPVMVRATPQFFIDLGHKVRGLALEALEKVEFKPPAAKNRLQSFTESRSDWCISRQRAWGVPIPVLFHTETDEPLIDREAIEQVINRIESLGSKGLDLWFTEEDNVGDWLPEKLKHLGHKYKKCQDTLDVWMDSGSSWSILEKTPVDIYLEGSDQHRGWFQSSLLLHVAMKGKSDPPFKRIVTHGFVLDEKRQKMSKSLGNTVKPQQIIDQLGIDGLRLLIAQSDYTSDISLNQTANQQVASMIKKFRLTFKYLLGNLQGCDDIPNGGKLSSLDTYVLKKLEILVSEVRQAYEDQDFQVVVKLIQAHMNTELSSIYFDAVKDTLYANALCSPERVGIQQVLWHVLETYVRMLAPILPFLTQEVWDLCPKGIRKDWDSPLMAGYPVLPVIQSTEEHIEKVELCLQFRDLINDAIEKARAAKKLGSSLACDIYIETPQAQFDSQLLETICIISKVHFGQVPVSEWCFQSSSAIGVVSCVPPSRYKCERCWKFTATQPESICGRCEDVVKYI